MFALSQLALMEAASLNTFLSLNIKKKDGMAVLHLWWEDMHRLTEQKGIFGRYVFTGLKEGPSYSVWNTYR